MPYQVSYLYPQRVYDRYDEASGQDLYKTEPALCTVEVQEDSRLEELLAAANRETCDPASVHAEHIPPTAEQARAQRDALLVASDWTQTLDAPIDPASRDAYRDYRQQLRDVPQQEGFPGSIQWPQEPKVTKALPDPVDRAVDELLGGGQA